VQVDISSIRDTEGAGFQTVVSANFPPFHSAGEEIRYHQPVTAELEFTNTGKLILAQGLINTVLTVACSRCLEPFNLELTMPFRLGYCENREQDFDPLDQDLEIRTFDGNFIDIGPDVEETVILSLPMKFMCSPDCRGLCAQCGQNLNIQPCDCKHEQIDPRLAILREFLDQQQ